jgi:serine/threonine protein kinase
LASDSRIGTAIAGYRIESVLGRGGMGVVYLAEQVALGRKVALKVLAPELAEDPRFRDRFLRESRIAATLEDPNILPVHEAGEADGALFIAMRYVRGTDLRRLIDEQGPLEPERTVSIVTQVASALDAAHAEGLIHRDVKPANVLLTPGPPDRVYLSDFGVTKRVSSESGLTKTGQFVGTLDYVAPEQIRGTDVDARADVYSLGCLLFECLTGEPPFRSDLEVTVLYAHLSEHPPKPSARRPELPAAIDAVVARAMAKRPEDRYASAGALAEAARASLGPTRAIPPPGRRRAVVLAGAVLAAIVAVTVVVSIALARGDSKPGATASSGGSPTPSRAASTLGFAQGVVSVDPATGSIGRRIPGPGTSECSGQSVGTIAAGEGGIWTAEGNALIHIDPGDGHTVRIPVNFPVAQIAVGDGAVWVAGATSCAGPDNVDRIDPATDEIRAQLSELGAFSSNATGIVALRDTVWFADSTGELTPIEPVTAHAGPAIDVGGDVAALSFGQGSLWAVDALAGKLLKLDPRTARVERSVALSGSLSAVAAGLGSVWVADSDGGVVLKIDPDSGEVTATVRVGERPTDIAVGFGAVWVTSQGDGTLWRIDPITGERASWQVGGPPSAVAVDPLAHRLWLVISPLPH